MAVLVLEVYGLLCQELLNKRSELLWLSHRREAQDTTTVARDEELGEVPLNARGECARCSALEVGEDRVFIAAIDAYLLHHREGDPVVERAEGSCIFARAKLLTEELTAGEAEDNQTTITIALIELFEACELRCEATLARRIDDQEDLACEL